MIDKMIDAFGSLNPLIVIGVIFVIALFYGLRQLSKKQGVVEKKITNSVSEKSEKSEKKEPVKLRNAYIWEEDGQFTPTKIETQIGRELIFSPSWPQSGYNSLCLKDDNGELVSYDARYQGVVSGDTPTSCYEAVDCSEVAAVYVDYTSLWEKFRALVPYIIAGGEVLILLSIVDKITGQ